MYFCNSWASWACGVVMYDVLLPSTATFGCRLDFSTSLDSVNERKDTWRQPALWDAPYPGADGTRSPYFCAGMLWYSGDKLQTYCWCNLWSISLKTSMWSTLTEKHHAMLWEGNWVVQGRQSLPVSTLKNILRDCLDTHTKGLWMPPPRHEIRIFDLVDHFSSKLKNLCWPLDKNVRSWPLFRPLTPPPPPLINGNVDHNLSNQNEKEF